MFMSLLYNKFLPILKTIGLTIVHLTDLHLASPIVLKNTIYLTNCMNF